jgi:outer membrane protein TolC
MFITWLVLSLAASTAAVGLPPADLGALLREAEAKNPEIAAARSRLSAAATVPSQMEAPPDPVAGVSYTNAGFIEPSLGDDPDAMLTLSWSQEVPYPGKLRLAGEAARREIDMSGRRLDQIRLDLLARVKESFADLYRIDRTSSILRESRELLISFMESARARYETGEGLLQNVLKAQTEIAKLDVELEKLAQERLSAVAALNALAGREGNEALGPALTLPESVAAVDAAALEEEALSHSPEILEADAAVRRDEARLDLARRQLKPDLMWGAAYTNRGDLDPMVMGAFGLRLPVYRQRKQAQGIIQAAHQLEAARLDVSAVRLKVVAQARDLLARVSRAEALARLYDEAVIPQARSSLESAAAAYGVGRVDFLTLMSDFATLLGYEVDYEAQRSERVSALSGLERLTGGSLIEQEAGKTPAREESHE